MNEICSPSQGLRDRTVRRSLRPERSYGTTSAWLDRHGDHARRFRYPLPDEGIDGIKIFYREAGPPNAPVVLLLHGFPTSSHMFRNLIPALADRYHVIAPDYPGYGQSDMPDRATFAYTFDRFAELVEACSISSASRATPCTSWTTVRRWDGDWP